jgi:hypothetical protein
MAFFIVQAIIVIFLFPEIWASAIFYRVLMLSINIAVSIFFGWRLYKQRYHMIFSYDEKGFTLKKGRKEEASHRWSEFLDVSIVRTEQGDFSIRLHNKEPFDLPISKLKLDPFNFRSEATKLVKANQIGKSD